MLKEREVFNKLTLVSNKKRPPAVPSFKLFGRLRSATPAVGFDGSTSVRHFGLLLPDRDSGQTLLFLGSPK